MLVNRGKSEYLSSQKSLLLKLLYVFVEIQERRKNDEAECMQKK